MTESCLISTHWCQVSKDCLHFVLVNYSSGLEHSWLYHFWPEALLHKVVDHHWTIGIVSQNCNWGIRGAVSTWPWNSFSGCCFFLDFVLVASDFLLPCSLPPQTSMIVNCPDPSTDWQRCFASALQGGGGGELCQRQRGRTMFGQSSPPSSAWAGGGWIFLETGFLNIQLWYALSFSSHGSFCASFTNESNFWSEFIIQHKGMTAADKKVCLQWIDFKENVKSEPKYTVWRKKV